MKPHVSDLQEIYGSSKVLPTTTIVLPLKPEKLEAVKKELSEIHPEVLLFLLKIKRLSVREHGDSSPMGCLSEVSITSERKPISLRSLEADTRIVHLSYGESAKTASNCCYYICKQVFPVKAENVVNGRNNIKEWVISIAFPFGKRINRGTSLVGIFAFLPTAMITNFPFIVQSDFILASSREAISLDNKWNMGILNQVPFSFVSALTTCMKSTETADFFSIPQLLKLLPVQISPYKELNGVREVIKTMLMDKCIVPHEPFSNENFGFCKPTDSIRILPQFRSILLSIMGSAEPLKGMYFQRRFVLHKSVDCDEYDQVWEFLQVPTTGDCNEWYGKCIQSCNLISRASTEMYVELLCFLADNWKHLPLRTVRDLPLLKYMTYNGEMMPCSLSRSKREKLKILLVWNVKKHAWLNKWNLAMGCPGGNFFVPDVVVTALIGNDKQHILKQWLTSTMIVDVISVSNYGFNVCYLLRTTKDPKLAVSFCHFLYHSGRKNYITADVISAYLDPLPIVNAQGNVVPCTKALVPAFGSRWMKLFGSNTPYTDEAYQDKCVVLGEVYAEATEFAGECTPERKLLDLFQKYSKTSDLPDILPEDAALKVASTQLTHDQAFLLLDWVRNLRAKNYEFRVKFIDSIQNGKWLKTYSGFSSPIKSFLCDGKEIAKLLEIGKTFEVLSAIDEEYYGDKIRSFKDELIFMGVQMKSSEDMYQLIADCLKHHALVSLSRECSMSLLRFVKYAMGNDKLDEEFLKTLKEGKWLKTTKGYVTPAGSVFLASNLSESLAHITSLQVVDNIYYGCLLDCFVDELKLLGVLVDLGDVYKLLPEYFRFPEDPSTMIKDSVFLLLECIHQLGPAALGLILKVRCHPWMKTSSGFRCPSESLLSDSKWNLLLDIIPLPIIDEAFYGIRIKSYLGELEAMGVTIDLDGSSKMVSAKLKLLSSSRMLTSANVISLLKCLKHMGESMSSVFINIRSGLLGEKWLKTCDGYRFPEDCVLYDPKWGTAQYVNLPLIDTAFYGVDILSFKDELKTLGVVVTLSEASHLVAKGLKLPNESKLITPECALSLLMCARSLRNSSKSEDQLLVEPFLVKLKGRKWMKTHMGYRSPEESIIFNPEWEGSLKLHDAPFIDERFYGTLSSLQKDDLRAIGVKADAEGVCYNIYKSLNFHNRTYSIVRIYKFLNKMKWSAKPGDELNSQLWIPNQCVNTGGKWVPAQSCVIHDDSRLFRSRWHALEEYYDVGLLSFFSRAFGVVSGPCLDDYIKLWNDWARCKYRVSPVELNSFWSYIAEDWNTEMESTVKIEITMLAATSNSGPIQFVNKEEVYIADDLQLTKAFMRATEAPLFVWLPQIGGVSSVSPTKLFKIYRSIGVRKISESVQVVPPTALENCTMEMTDLNHSLLNKALVKIVLGFLASPCINMPVEMRHKAAKSLIGISVFGTHDPIMVNHVLNLHSLKKKLSVEIRRTVLWEKNFKRLLVHKASWEQGNTNIEFVTTFARAISEAVLPTTDLLDRLCNIINMAFAFGFREDDVDFLLMKENLELSVEDEKFLDRAFSPVKPPSPKRRKSCHYYRATF